MASSKRLKVDGTAADITADTTITTGSTTIDHPPSSSTTSIRAASRKNRVYVFREFVQQTYALQPNAVVLDVAGGKGDLSWLLKNVDRVKSVVVDPRITKSQHILRSIQYLKDHPEQAQERAIPGRLTYQPLATLLPKLKDRLTFDTPHHLRLLVNQELVSAIREYKDNGDFQQWKEFWDEASKQAIAAQPLGYKEEESQSNQELLVQDASEALQTLLSTELVMGFHPDQATDPAMDLAILLQVPFCIVPCCVFPQEFPHRTLSNGNRVRNYSELIQYLQETYQPRVDKLPFHFTDTAKNVVLFTLPGDGISK